jgi:hypothetical protein
MKNLFLFLLAALVYVAHQDWWNWRAADPMIFGFLPIGLAYHAAYSIVAAVMMALLVKFAWPRSLKEREMASPESRAPHS